MNKLIIELCVKLLDQQLRIKQQLSDNEKAEIVRLLNIQDIVNED